MAHTLLRIPAPEVEGLVRPRLGRHSPDQVSPDPAEVAAHVTLLSPFAGPDALDDGLLAELAAFFADVLPFGYRLTEVARFPRRGPVYLAPTPAAPFRRLVLALAARFPEYPPYAGRFGEVVPHLTVPTLPEEDLAAVRREVSALLPVEAHAREAELYWQAPGASRTLGSFPFGVQAA